jgi:hypothetical protein
MAAPDPAMPYPAALTRRPGILRATATADNPPADLGIRPQRQRPGFG